MEVEKCIQCNQCAYVCPHAVIRPFLTNDEELKNAPKTYETKKAIGKGLEGQHCNSISNGLYRLW